MSEIRIALCGLGSAGRSRLKALDAVEGAALAGVVSRRAEVSTLSWSDALQDPSIQAIAISTENTDHAARAKDALRAGKHVLCDYPLAFKADEAKSLFQLAAQQKRVLHVEHIGLLTQAHRAAKNEIALLGQLGAGEYVFQGGWNEKIADAARTGPYSFLAISRLMQVADLFGAFQIQNPRYRESSDGFSFKAQLQFSNGGSLEFTEERRTGLSRNRRLCAKFEKGNWEWKADVQPEGLFAKDLAHFIERVQNGVGCYYDEGLLLQVTEALEKNI